MTDTNSNPKTVKEEFSSLCQESFRSHLISYLINLCTDLRSAKPSQDYFSVSDVENIYRLKAASTIPLQDGEDNLDGFYGRKNKSLLSLRTLHCLNYKFFNDGMKKLLPHLVIDALDYDDNSLRAFLGDDDYSKVLAAINEPTQSNEPTEKKEKRSLLKTVAIIVSAPFLIYFFYNFGTKLSLNIIEKANKLFVTENVTSPENILNQHFLDKKYLNELLQDAKISTDELIDIAKKTDEQEKNKVYEKMMKEGGEASCYKKTTYVCDNQETIPNQHFLDKKYINELLQDVNSIEKSHPKDPAGSNIK